MAKEDIWYIVPELEIRVHEAWVNLSEYCRKSFPYGSLSIRIANGLPTKRLKEVPSIRVDRQDPASVKNGTWYLIPSIEVRVHEYWINLVFWCQNYFTSGDLGLKVIAGQPTELVSCNQKVDFSKKETIPPGIPLTFNREAKV